MRLHDWRAAILLASCGCVCRLRECAPPASGRARHGAAEWSIDTLRTSASACSWGPFTTSTPAKPFPDATIPSVPHLSRGHAGVSAGKGIRAERSTRCGGDARQPRAGARLAADLLVARAAGFARTSSDHADSLHTFLKGIAKTGSGRHGRPLDQGSQKMPELPTSGTNGTRWWWGVSSGGFPFAAVQNNELAGFDVELARRFAAYLGKEVRSLTRSSPDSSPSRQRQDRRDHRRHVRHGRTPETDRLLDPYFEQNSVGLTVKSNTVGACAPVPAKPAIDVSFVDSLLSSFQATSSTSNAIC